MVKSEKKNVEILNLRWLDASIPYTVNFGIPCFLFSYPFPTSPLPHCICYTTPDRASMSSLKMSKDRNTPTMVMKLANPTGTTANTTML